MKKLAVITGLVISTIAVAGPARADYYNTNCSSYGSFDNCSGYDSSGGRYSSQGSQIGNSYYGTERYSAPGYDYESRNTRQQIGNFTYDNYNVSTPNGDYSVRCTTQRIGSQVYRNCN